MSLSKLKLRSVSLEGTSGGGIRFLRGSCDGAAEVRRLVLLLVARGGKGSTTGSGAGLMLLARLERVTRRSVGWFRASSSDCEVDCEEDERRGLLRSGCAGASGLEEAALDRALLPPWLEGFAGDGGADQSCSDSGGWNSSSDPIPKVSTVPRESLGTGTNSGRGSC